MRAPGLVLKGAPPARLEKSAIRPSSCAPLGRCRHFVRCRTHLCRSPSRLGWSSGFSNTLDRSPAFSALLSEPHCLGKFRASLGVARCHHRVVVRQVPLGPVLLGGHAKGCAQMTLQRLEPLSVLKADDGVRCHRFPHRHRRHQLRLRLFLLTLGCPRKGGMDGVEQGRQVCGWDGVLADISRYDIGGEFNEIWRA